MSGMMDLILFLILFLIYLSCRFLERNVKKLGWVITALTFYMIMFSIGMLGETVDKERFFEKTAFSIILIFAMIVVCAVYVWKTVSKIQK